MLDLKKQGILCLWDSEERQSWVPKDFENEKNMSRRKFQFRCSGQDIKALVWKDRKPIQFLSNFQKIENVNTASRKSKDGSHTEISCPDIVKDCNTYIGLVDKSDMLKSIYEIDRKKNSEAIQSVVAGLVGATLSSTPNRKRSQIQ
ncbi:uncharacterized protein LOC126268035 [Schistocerca gregaria]|uniref:uncharacterized protein LOC126268035 n=1 Tax=Schistocerca gregaria TaxID=7010 RepID=UPI00211E7582|nr:uncharacterized protein LOC126268035 [Schistocerca gregaria]